MLKWLVIRIQRLKWSISRKLLLAFSLILTLFIVNSVITFVVQLKINQTEQTQTRQNSLLQDSQELRRLLRSQNDLYTNVLFIQDKNFSFSDTFTGEISDSLRRLQLRKEELGPQASILLGAFASSYRQVLVAVSPIADQVSQGNILQARQTWPTTSELFKTASRDLDNFYNLQVQAYHDLDQHKGILLQFSLIFIVLLGLLSLLIGAGLAYLFNRCIGRPLYELQACLDEVATGNLNRTVRVENQDELGRLAQALNMAVANLRQVINGVRIGEHLQTLVQNLSSSSSQQATGSTQQLSSTTEIIQAMAQLTLRAEHISANALTVANTSQQTSSQMAALQQVANRAGQMIGEVQSVVSNTVEQVGKVNQTLTNLNIEMAQLNIQSVEIDGVIDIIANITEEVHLLALNAAIEAASAGQYGERFKVIAGEIKSLANRTKHNTAQITGLIQLVQHSAQQVTNQTQEACGVAEEVVLLNRQLATIILAMNSVVSQTVTVAGEVGQATHLTDVQVEEIRQATHDQMSASVQINQALQSIGHMAQENVINTQTIATSTSHLDTISAQLVKTLAGINLN